MIKESTWFTYELEKLLKSQHNNTLMIKRINKSNLTFDLWKNLLVIQEKWLQNRSS